MEKKKKELNCWNHSVLEKPKREIVTSKLHLNIPLDFTRRNRRFRCLPRSNTFWWESVWNSYSDDRFKQTLRLSRSTFTLVLSLIRHKPVKEYVANNSRKTSWNLPIPSR